MAILLRLIKGKNPINKTHKINKSETSGNWDKQKGLLKQRFAILTDNDLMFVNEKIAR